MRARDHERRWRRWQRWLSAVFHRPTDPDTGFRTAFADGAERETTNKEKNHARR